MDIDSIIKDWDAKLAVLAEDDQYDHQKFCSEEIRNVRGIMETGRRGRHAFFNNFPADRENWAYLESQTQEFEELEAEVDSWEEMMAGMSEEAARKKVNRLRWRAFGLLSRMGPAAEAYSLVIRRERSPDFILPERVTVRHWSAVWGRKPVTLSVRAARRRDYERSLRLTLEREAARLKRETARLKRETARLKRETALFNRFTVSIKKINVLTKSFATLRID